MIRILYMSDLHIEMERWRLSVPGWAAFRARHKALATHPARGPLLDQMGKVDLVVLAGDVHNGLRGMVYADQVARYLAAPVVYLAGNHEFYHQNMDRLLPALSRAAAGTQGRVQFLENASASFTMNGERLHVLGCTLWTDYALNGAPSLAMETAQARMNDHRFITSAAGVLRPRQALARHETSRLWLHTSLAQLRKTEPGSRIVIATHHAPSRAALGTRTGGIAPAYGSDMLAEFTPYAPAAWIHGHTHYRHETVDHGITLVSAPRGYVGYDGEALNFVPGVLEV
jgi:predicted MPP superfamily phosphohydrolase